MAESHSNSTRVVLSLVIVAAIAAGTAALLEFRPKSDQGAASMKSDEAAAPMSPGAAVVAIAGKDRQVIHRLRLEGKDIPWHWRRKLVRRTAPVLARWIGATEERLVAAGTEKIPAALFNRLALSFQAHELLRARFVVNPGAFAQARDAGYHFGRSFAIPLGRVIVFRDHEAVASEAEWVRQLALSRSYHRWGSERFAAHYLQEWRRIDRASSRMVARHTQAVATIYGIASKTLTEGR
jgi:hypothetical protein